MEPAAHRSVSNANQDCLWTHNCKKTLQLATKNDPARVLLSPGQLTFLFLLWALQTPLVAAKIDLDLTPDSFDDQYQGCGQQVMEELNQGDYFMKEVDTHKIYSRVWQKAHLHWLNQAAALPWNVTSTHAVAVLVYALNPNVRSDFSRAMASVAGSPEQYKQSFHFKYLHYYLTSAIQLLRKKNTSCYEVHHQIKDVRLEVNLGSTIRFGQFLSTSLLGEEQPKFGNLTLFTIVTCLGAPLRDLSLRKEVLIPPYEFFEVTAKSLSAKGNLLYLQSAGNQSKYNCQLLKASSQRCSPTASVVTAFLSLLAILVMKTR